MARMVSKVRNRRRTDSSSRQVAAKRVTSLLLPVVATLLTAVAVVAGGWVGGQRAYAWALQSEKLALQTVTIDGNKHASTPELLKLAGLAVGQNLLALDPEVIQTAMSQHPWVRGVEVRRRFPHALNIRVEEHQPAAMVSLGDLYVVNEEGEPFKRLQAQDGVDLPLVTGVDREAFVSKRDETLVRLKRALDMAAAYEASVVSHGAPLSEVRLTNGGVTLITGPSGQEIRMGDGATKEKLARLAKVRTELAHRGVRAGVIHLDNRSRPGWVAVKLAVAGSERTGDLPQ